MCNDLVPEEQEQEYRQLLTVLQSASAGQAPITATEQKAHAANLQGSSYPYPPVSPLICSSVVLH